MKLLHTIPSNVETNNIEVSQWSDSKIVITQDMDQVLVSLSSLDELISALQDIQRVYGPNVNRGPDLNPDQLQFDI